MTLTATLRRWLAAGRPAAPPTAPQATPGADRASPVPEAPSVPPAPAPAPLATTARGRPGHESRAWRNRNPSNLRPPSSWRPAGMVGIDTNPGGPFCVFGSEAHGWQALATRVLQLHRSGKDTVRELISVWAPPSDGNNTERYIAGVAGKLGVSPDAPIDPRRIEVMLALAEAIRQHEGKASDPPWDVAARDAGLAAGIKAA